MKNLTYLWENFIVSPALIAWFILLAFIELCTLPFSRDNLNKEDES
jgi:hypothetical protein